MAVLYRKYRPQTFAEVLSQKPIVQTLKNQVKTGAVAHAYLFTGSRGVGKTSVARILAKAVDCEGYKDTGIQGDGDACGECSVCKQIEAGSFMDLVEIDAASNTGVDNIRELIEHVKFSPSRGKYKVFIIDEVHMLSKGAFNALLKTLEEPPKHAIFILATTEINKVPATIISRTQRFEFKAYSSADLMPLLEKVTEEEKVNFKKEILELVAGNAEGSARDALSILDKIMTLGSTASLEEVQQLLGVTDIRVCENLLEIISFGQAGKIPDFFLELTQKGLDYSVFNRDFLEFLRKALIHKITDGKVASGLSDEHAKKLNELSAMFTAADLIYVMRLFLKSYKDISGSPNAEVPLLVASIEAALRKSGQESKSVSGSVNKMEQMEVIAPRVTEQPKIKSETVKQEVPQAVVSNFIADEAITLEEASKLWPKMVAKVKEINGPLASLLKACQIKDVLGNKVVVGVKFQFDKQSLENAKNAGLINSIFLALSGKNISILGQVLKTEINEGPGAAEVISDVLKVFGGELVE